LLADKYLSKDHATDTYAAKNDHYSKNHIDTNFVNLTHLYNNHHHKDHIDTNFASKLYVQENFYDKDHLDEYFVKQQNTYTKAEFDYLSNNVDSLITNKYLLENFGELQAVSRKRVHCILDNSATSSNNQLLTKFDIFDDSVSDFRFSKRQKFDNGVQIKTSSINSVTFSDSSDNPSLTIDQSNVNILKPLASLPTCTAVPTLSSQLTNKSYVDGLDTANVKTTGNQTIAGTKTFSSFPECSLTIASTNQLTNKKYVDDNFYTKSYIDGQLGSIQNNYVPNTGTSTIAGAKTFTGLCTFSQALSGVGPTAASHLTTKQYVDSALATQGSSSFVTLSGDQSILGIKTFTVLPKSTVAPTNLEDFTTKNYVDAYSYTRNYIDSNLMSLLSSQTVTASKTFAGSVNFTNIATGIAPTSDNHLATKNYVDTVAGVVGGVVLLTSDQTISGKKTFTFLPQSTALPNLSTDLVNKNYVDGLDATNIKLTGDQNVSGIKNFTNNIQTIQPTAATHVANKQYVDENFMRTTTDQTVSGTKTFADQIIISNPNIGSNATNKTYVDGLDVQNLKLTGNQIINGIKEFLITPECAVDPTSNSHLTNKLYVDNKITQGSVLLTGDQLISGVKSFSSLPVSSSTVTSSNQLTNKTYVDSLDVTNIKLTGDQTVSGIKTFTTLPESSVTVTASNQLTNKNYVDTANAENVKLIGDQSVSGIKTFSSAIHCNTGATAGTHLTTKQYVDDLNALDVKLTGNQTISGIKTFVNLPESSAQVGTSNQLTNKTYVDTVNAANVKLTGDQSISGIKTFASAIHCNTTATAATHLVTKEFAEGLLATSGQVSLSNDQTITGLKTFTQVPICSVSPQQSSQLVNKEYADLLNSTNIKNTGDQSVAGIKTFSTYPQCSDNTVPSLSSQLVTKSYVDTLDLGNVKLTGDQQINGTKIFSSAILCGSGSLTSNPGSALVNKTYVDSNFVNLADTQSITGSKTFTTQPSCTVNANSAHHLTNKTYVDAVNSSTRNRVNIVTYEIPLVSFSNLSTMTKCRVDTATGNAIIELNAQDFFGIGNAAYQYTDNQFLNLFLIFNPTTSVWTTGLTLKINSINFVNGSTSWLSNIPLRFGTLIIGNNAAVGSNMDIDISTANFAVSGVNYNTNFQLSGTAGRITEPKHISQMSFIFMNYTSTTVTSISKKFLLADFIEWPNALN